MRMKKLLSMLISASMLVSCIPAMAADADVSSTLKFYDTQGIESTASEAAYVSGSATINASSGYDGAKYMIASYTDSSCAKMSGISMANFELSGQSYTADIAKWEVAGNKAVKEFYLDSATLKPLASSKLTKINGEKPVTYKVEGENFSATTTQTYYLVNNAGWYGTIDFSNGEALQINSLSAATYNIMTVPAGTYSVKLYGGNVVSGSQATLTMTINGDIYTISTPAIDGIGNYNYESVNISDSLEMTGNDTIVITGDNTNWAGIDYIEFTPTSEPAVTHTPEPLTGDVWTVNIAWQNTVPDGTHADVYNSTIRTQAASSPAQWKKYDVTYKVVKGDTSFELVTMEGQSSWTMQGNCLKCENDGGTISYADCTDYNYDDKTVTLRLWANANPVTPSPSADPTETPIPTPKPTPTVVPSGLPTGVPVSPSEGATVELTTTKQKNFLSMDRASMSNEAMNLYWFTLGDDSSRPKAVSFSWTTTAAESYLEVSEDASFTNPRVVVTTENTASMTNFKVGTKYYWRVNKGSVATFTTESGVPRFIEVDGVANVRDIGGYSVVGDKKIKQGMLYRGAALDETGNFWDSKITDKGISTMLDELGMKSVIDLRGYDTSPLGSGVTYFRYGMVSYKTLLDVKGYGRIKIFFDDIFANENNYPIYFHCSGGADRTGSIAAILGLFLGMDEEDVFTEYELTTLSKVGNRSRNNDTGTDACFVAFWTAIQAMEGDTNQEKITNYLKTECGISQSTLDKVAANLLE